MTDEWMTPAELSAEIKTAMGTLRQWRHRGVGPASVKLGGVRYRRSEVNRWIAEQEARETQRTAA